MKLHVKSASFSTDNGQTSRMSIFYCVSNHKNLNLTYLDNALTYRFRLNLRSIEAAIGGKSYRERFWKNSSQRPRYIAASKIGNSVISLLWQLRCRCNPDHNKFSSLSTGNPGSVIVPQYDSSKITVFVLGEKTILKFEQIITKLHWSNKDNNN